MAQHIVDETKQEHPTPGAVAIKEIIRMTAFGGLIGALIFLPAGRLDWTMGWVFLGLWLVPKLAYVFLLLWRDPDLLAERATRHEDTKRWDKIILPVYFVFGLATFLVGGLDGGRFRWSGEIPPAVIAAAIIIYLLGNSLSGWVVLTNRYASSEARIQSDRGQQVIAAGPYRFVRHPMYLVAVLIWPVTPLILESWWAMIPGTITALIMVIRTVYEDRMLLDELPGYAEYAQQTRFRLFPGIW
ncbi:MAG: isoprenylcysteine carboxylmethyltransferase family protein [Anaerolineae bacterium]|nr:isoprenylcysteine carboxylmethyltransferase family protein [Anaerolineae bacterium]